MILNKVEYKNYVNYCGFAINLLFIIVIVGGLTRLTDSGLSITRWEIVISGILTSFNKTVGIGYLICIKKFLSSHY